ncbi:MAG: hypothetical protein V4719_27220 [Planctomycetota bacterium]
MKMFSKLVCCVVILSLIGRGPRNKLFAQVPTPASKTSSASTDAANRDGCRALKLADELVTKLDLSHPLAAMLLVDIGQLEAKSGDLDAVRELLRQLDQQKEFAQGIVARAKLKIALASGLAAINRLDQAEEVVRQIEDFQADERCVAFSEIAKQRAIQGDQAEATRFWKLAEESVANEKDVKQRRKSQGVMIRSLAEAGRIDEAKKRAAGMEARYDDRSGWGPVAERLVLQGDTATAEQIIKFRLPGANMELYQLIAVVAPKGGFIEGRAALHQMDDPALAASACHLLAVAMARRGNRDMATLQLKDSWSYMDIAKPDHEQSGRILLSSIDPTAALVSVKEALVICQEFEKKFPANLAADAYRRLATHCPADAKEDQIRFLEIAQTLSQNVRDPVDQIACIQRIFRTRSALLGEEPAIQAAEKLANGLNHGYALLGIAEGRLLPDKK